MGSKLVGLGSSRAASVTLLMVKIADGCGHARMLLLAVVMLSNIMGNSFPRLVVRGDLLIDVYNTYVDSYRCNNTDLLLQNSIHIDV